jgi:hypothetical protein
MSRRILCSCQMRAGLCMAEAFTTRSGGCSSGQACRRYAFTTCGTPALRSCWQTGCHSSPRHTSLDQSAPSYCHKNSKVANRINVLSAVRPGQGRCSDDTVIARASPFRCRAWAGGNASRQRTNRWLFPRRAPTGLVSCKRTKRRAAQAAPSAHPCRPARAQAKGPGRHSHRQLSNRLPASQRASVSCALPEASPTTLITSCRLSAVLPS